MFLLLVAAAAAHAQDARYVSDEIAIVLREAPRGDGASRGIVTTGTRVLLLESDEVSGYVRVRTPDNREGWMLKRYLKREPVAREKLQRAETELAAAQAEAKKLREENARLMDDFARISGGQPIASRELVQETEHLRTQLAQKEQEVAAIREEYGAKRASQQTLLLGGALVAGGFLLALLLRWLWPKRRWGDL